MIIGLIGGAGAGKDTFAEALPPRYERRKFAGPLKNMFRTLLAVQGVTYPQRERMIEGDLKEVPSKFLEGKTPREAMQTLGTEWGRNLIGPDLWVNAAMQGLAGDAVFTDVRFPNEAKAIKAAGGMLFRIVRADATRVAPHESESALDDFHADWTVHNGMEITKAAFQDFARVLVKDAETKTGIFAPEPPA